MNYQINEVYTLKVLGETKGKLNGLEMGSDKEYVFTY